MAWTRLIILLLALLGPAAPALARDLSADEAAGDLRFFRDVYMARDRSFGAEARARALALLDARIAHPAPMTRAQLALVFAEAQAFTGNNHTQNEVLDEEGDFHVLPIAFWSFQDGAFITRTHPDFTALLGARIVSIGGVPFDAAAARVDRFISGTAQHRRYERVNWLRRLEVLQAAGLAGDDGADFVVEKDGARSALHLKVTPSRDPAVLSAAWRESLVPGKGSPPWPQVTDRLGALPPFLQPPADLAWTLLDEGRLLYIRSNDLQDYDATQPLRSKAYALFDDVLRRPAWPRDVIVDLRFNEGGDFLKILVLAHEIVAVTAPRGRIYVITGRATNSAAIIFTALLRGRAKDRVLIVGEEASDHPAFWSEGGVLTAPASGLPLRFTDGYHDWARGCTDRTRCYWPAMLHGVAAGSLTPDIPAQFTFDDYASGRDPEMAAIRADLQRRYRSRS